MKHFFTLLFFFVSLSFIAQDTLRQSIVSEPRKGLALYPLQKQIGYRSNLYRVWFTDFKGGITISALPFLTLELNRCKRFVRKEQVNVYAGIGVTFDSYIPGVQVPIGIEVIPIKQVNNLTVIAEVKPKMTFGPTNFLNVSFSPHIGICYYLKTSATQKK
jgi:hypothetical protein